MSQINHELGKSIHRDHIEAADKRTRLKHLQTERVAQALMKTANEIQQSVHYAPSTRERLLLLRLGILGR